MKKGQLVYTSQPPAIQPRIAEAVFHQKVKHSRPTPTVGQYYRVLHMKLKHFNEWKKGRCHFCGFKDAFLIRPDSGAYKCRKCGVKGNGLIQLHMELSGISYGQARDQLAAMVEVAI